MTGREATGRPKVVHIITKLEWGGAQENTLFTVSSLDPARFEKVLIVGRGGLLDDRATSTPGVRTIFVPSLVRELNPFVDLRAYRELRAILLAEKLSASGPLVVHTHSSKAGILGRAAAVAVGAEVVVHSIHGFGFHDFQNPIVRRIYVALERHASKGTDVFVAVARESVARGVREGIFEESRCRVIRSGFDTRRFIAGDRAVGRRLLGVPDGVPLVGTVAVFKAQKAPLDFVAAARKIADEIPGVHFAMVGEGELLGVAKDVVAAAGLADRFRFPGWRSEIPDLLSAFDLFLLTSLWEGLPKVVPQALIAGVPVVATAVNGTAEAIVDGVDGILVPPADSVAVARAACDILSGRRSLTPGVRREEFISEFDENLMVSAQESLYLEILSRKGFA